MALNLNNRIREIVALCGMTYN